MNPARRTLFRRRVISGLRVLIGAVFVYAGQAKIRDPASFADSIASFRLLPSALDNLMALGLPPFEILLGLFLAAGWRRRTMAFCALLTSGIFFLALGSAWVRRIPVDCGCFGTNPSVAMNGPHLWLSLGRDLLLFIGAAVVYVDAWRRKEPRGVRLEGTGV